MSAAADDAIDLDLPGGTTRHEKQHQTGSHQATPSSSSLRRDGGGGTPAVMTVNGFRRGETGGLRRPLPQRRRPGRGAVDGLVRGRAPVPPVR
jgi:hypothetical protein